MGTRENRLTEAVLTSTHNLCFSAKIRKSIIFFHLNIIIFIALKNRSILHGLVFVMCDTICPKYGVKGIKTEDFDVINYGRFHLVNYGHFDLAIY